MHHNTQKGRVQMKQIKKTVVALLCVCMLFAVGCGTKENANDNGNTTTNTDKKNTDGDGVMEDVGRGIDNGVRDVVDGVEDTVDDVTENNRKTTVTQIIAQQQNKEEMERVGRNATLFCAGRKIKNFFLKKFYIDNRKP